MKKLLLLLTFLLTGTMTYAQNSTMARGADVSWCTEMEADGRKFYNAAGTETELFALMKEIGMTAIRLRVWVNPAKFGYGAWCDKADVVAKAKRAHAQGLDLMIDFHYSDCFADPGTQTKPLDWINYTSLQLKKAVADHTKDVLQALKDEGIEPRWVQIGNETNQGMIWDNGKINWNLSGSARFTNYATLSNAGYDAAKEIFPNALVLVHFANAHSIADYDCWLINDFKAAGGKFDAIGLSHYPKADEWNSEQSETVSNANAAKGVKAVATKFSVPVLIVETGYSSYNAALASAVMKDLFQQMEDVPQCAGIFYWEPEVDGQWKPSYYNTQEWGAYGMGAFTTDGKPTSVLDAFKGTTEEENTYPAELKIYDQEGQKVLATLLPATNNPGLFYGQLNAEIGWLNFHVVDEESGTWYGTDPSDKTMLSTSENKWRFWIDSATTGVYDIEVNLATMTWTHKLNESATLAIFAFQSESHSEAHRYDLQGRRLQQSAKGLHIIRTGKKAHKVYMR